MAAAVLHPLLEKLVQWHHMLQAACPGHKACGQCKDMCLEMPMMPLGQASLLKRLRYTRHTKQLQLQQKSSACQTVTRTLLRALNPPDRQHLSLCGHKSIPDLLWCQPSPRGLCHSIAAAGESCQTLICPCSRFAAALLDPSAYGTFFASVHKQPVLTRGSCSHTLVCDTMNPVPTTSAF